MYLVADNVQLEFTLTGPLHLVVNKRAPDGNSEVVVGEVVQTGVQWLDITSRHQGRVRELVYAICKAGIENDYDKLARGARNSLQCLGMLMYDTLFMRQGFHYNLQTGYLPSTLPVRIPHAEDLGVFNLGDFSLETEVTRTTGFLFRVSFNACVRNHAIGPWNDTPAGNPFAYRVPLMPIFHVLTNGLASIRPFLRPEKEDINAGHDILQSRQASVDKHVALKPRKRRAPDHKKSAAIGSEKAAFYKMLEAAEEREDLMAALDEQVVIIPAKMPTGEDRGLTLVIHVMSQSILPEHVNADAESIFFSRGGILLNVPLRNKADIVSHLVQAAQTPAPDLVDPTVLATEEKASEALGSGDQASEALESGDQANEVSVALVDEDQPGPVPPYLTWLMQTLLDERSNLFEDDFHFGEGTSGRVVPLPGPLMSDGERELMEIHEYFQAYPQELAESAEADSEDPTFTPATLIICQSSARYAWKQQLDAKFKDKFKTAVFHNAMTYADIPADQPSVVIASYAQIACCIRSIPIPNFVDPMSLQFERVIYDDAHTLKNMYCQQARICNALTARKRWCFVNSPASCADIAACRGVNMWSTVPLFARNSVGRRPSVARRFFDRFVYPFPSNLKYITPSSRLAGGDSQFPRLRGVKLTSRGRTRYNAVVRPGHVVRSSPSETEASYRRRVSKALVKSMRHILGEKPPPLGHLKCVKKKVPEEVCPICFDDLKANETVVIDGCGHSLCMDCAASCVERGIKKCSLCRGKAHKMSILVDDEFDPLTLVAEPATEKGELIKKLVKNKKMVAVVYSTKDSEKFFRSWFQSQNIWVHAIKTTTTLAEYERMRHAMPPAEKGGVYLVSRRMQKTSLFFPRKIDVLLFLSPDKNHAQNEHDAYWTNWSAEPTAQKIITYVKNTPEEAAIVTGAWGRSKALNTVVAKSVVSAFPLEPV